MYNGSKCNCNNVIKMRRNIAHKFYLLLHTLLCKIFFNYNINELHCIALSNHIYQGLYVSKNRGKMELSLNTPFNLVLILSYIQRAQVL